LCTMRPQYSVRRALPHFGQCDRSTTTTSTAFLLPAWPKDGGVDFRLHAPKQTVVEGKVRGGRVETLNVTLPGRTKDVVMPGPFILQGTVSGPAKTGPGAPGTRQETGGEICGSTG